MSQQIQKNILQQFEPIKKIGSGAYGHVWKVTNRRKRTTHALKKNFDAFQNSTDAQRTYRQIMFLQQFKHPNIVELQNILKAQNDKDIYLLFEYMDIDLYTLIRQNILGERHKRYIIYQIAKGLFYLHSAQLVHRDIKPSNILVNENCLAKLCDFGLVRSVDQEKGQQPPMLTQYIATRWYRAPEILLGSRRYSKPVDVWSFGCLLGEIIRGKPLFPGNSTLNQIERVMTWVGPPSLADIKALKTDFGKQMLDLLSKIKQINKKQWFPHAPQDGLDLLNKTLQFNPDKRPTMLQILQHPYLKQFYNENQIISSDCKIKAFVSDNHKLSLKDYRMLIYKQIKQKNQSLTPSPLSSMQVTDLDNPSGIHQSRLKKSVIRSSSKQRQGSAPNSNVKDSRTISIKKKYDSLIGKREQLSKTKCVKTQQKDGQGIIQKRKKNQNLVKFFWDKKKKSSSLYEGKRQSQVLAKYMYKNRYC